MNTELLNPLKNVSVEELNNLMISINSNFKVVKNLGSMDIDLHTKWYNLYNDCLGYAYHNHKIITKDYPIMLDRTYVDIVKIMIIEELKIKSE